MKIVINFRFIFQFLLSIFLFVSVNIKVYAHTHPEPEKWQDNSHWLYKAIASKFADNQENYQNAIYLMEGIAEASSQHESFAYTYDLALSMQDFSKAQIIAQKWLEAHPDDIQARMSLIRALFEQNKTNESLNEIKLLLKKDSSIQNVAQIANLLSFLQDEKSRISILQELSREFPNNPFILYYLGTQAKDLGYVEIALNAFLEALKTDKNWRQVELLLINSLSDIGEIKQARSHLQKMRKMHPEDSSLFELELEILVKNNRWDEAQKLLKKFPKNKNLNTNILAQIYSANGNVKQAQAIYREMLEKGEISNDWFLFSVAQAELAAKHNKKAREYLAQISEKSRNYFPAQQQIAVLTFLDKEIVAAREICADLRKRFPDYSLEIYQIEIAQLDMAEEFQAAEQTINQALEQYPDNSELLYNKAAHFVKINDIEAAESTYQYILSKDPENIDALNAYGYLLLSQNNRHAEAKTMIEQAVKKYPESPAIQDSYALLMLKENRNDEALIWSQRAYSVYRSDEITAHYLEILMANKKKSRAKEVLNSIKLSRKSMPNSLAIAKKLGL